MFQTVLFVLLSFSPALSSSAPARAAAIQDPVVDKRPEVAALITKLDGHVEKKGAEDREGVAVIDSLTQEFGKSGPKDKASIVKALSKCFEARRLEPQDGVPNNQLYIGAATALGAMAPESTKTLVSWVNAKTLRKDLAVQSALLRSLGKTKDKEAIKTLVDMLENKESALISAAAQALGEFAGAELEVRRNIFESLLKVLMASKGARDQDLNDSTAREKYDVISAPIITSLGRLSKHDERDPDKWQYWWNKNKKANWDEEK